MNQSMKLASRRRNGPSRQDLSEDSGRDAAPSRHGCLWCPDWEWQGTFGEGKVAAELHRAARHPEARMKKKRIRTARGVDVQPRPDEERVAEG